MSLIRLEHVTKLYDPDLILDDISVSIEHGDRLGLIGRNGTGKTTLIKIINGMLTNFKGKVVAMFVENVYCSLVSAIFMEHS